MHGNYRAKNKKNKREKSLERSEKLELYVFVGDNDKGLNQMSSIAIDIVEKRVRDN